MKAQEYCTYALDAKHDLINIHDAKKGNEYHCPHCRGIMIPRQGKIRCWHFAHKANQEHCSYETYLHATAKRLLKRLFTDSQNFVIRFNANFICALHECLIGSRYLCNWTALKTVNLKNFYTDCDEEATIGNYRADLLVRNKSNDNYAPILIEIIVTHKSTEQKLSSGYQIIEIRINSIDDIEKIISDRAICENDNVKFYNWKPYYLHPDEIHSDEQFRPQSEHLFKCLRQDSRDLIDESQIHNEMYNFTDVVLQAPKKLTNKYRSCDLCMNFIYNGYTKSRSCTRFKSNDPSRAMNCPNYIQSTRYRY